MDDVGNPKTLDNAPPPTANLPDVRPLRSPRKRQHRPPETRVPASIPPSENPRCRGRPRASSGTAKSPGVQATVSSAQGAAPREGEAGVEPFRVGDFVWGKLKISSWWPGKVVDPSSERAAKAKKHGEEQCLAVFFFGHGTVAWYEPSQLKPFKKEFKSMTEQNSSEDFAAAITDALAEVKDAVDSEMACLLDGGQEKRDAVTRYALRPREFLELVHDTARMISCIDKLDATMLRCCAVAYCSWNESLAEEVVQNAGISTSMNDKLEQECQVPETGRGTMRRPEMSDEVKQMRKKRSISELIGSKQSDMKDQNAKSNKCLEEATTAMVAASGQSRKRNKKGLSNKVSVFRNDVNVVSEEKQSKFEGSNPSSSTHHKRNKIDETNKSSDMKNGGSRDVEETGSSRRERKVSRYLSPPYTNVSGYTKCSFSFKDEASAVQNESKASQLPLTGSLLSINDSKEVSQKKDIMTTPFLNLDEISAHAILSECLSAAANPLRLKRNRSSKELRYFFEKFRSSAYADGSDSGNYNKFLDKLSNEHHISKVVDLGAHSVKEKTTGKKSKRKNVMNTSMEHDHNSQPIEYSRKRKSRSNKSDAKSSTSVDHKGSNGSTEVEDNGKERSISGDAGKTKLQQVRKLKVTDALNSKTSDGLPVSKANKRRKKSEAFNEVDTTNALDLDHKTLSSSKGTNLRKQGKKKVGTISECPVSLVLKFTTGTELPSKDELVSKHSIYGELDESHTEVLQDSRRACVVFKSHINAEKAVNSLYSDGALGSSVSSYKLCCDREKISRTSPASMTPLPFVRKSLEKMISVLTGFTPPERDGRSSNHLGSEVRDDLIGEMANLLKKVNTMLDGPSAGT